jgi:hypothetical protein
MAFFWQRHGHSRTAAVARPRKMTSKWCPSYLVSGLMYCIAPNLPVFPWIHIGTLINALGYHAALHNAQKPHAARAAFAQPPYYDTLGDTTLVAGVILPSI